MKQQEIGAPVSVLPGWTQAKTIDYDYDAASNRTELKWPDAYRARYAYDALDRLATVTQVEGALPGTSTLLATYVHDLLDRKTNVTLGTSGGTGTWTWSKAGQLDLLTHNLNGATNDSPMTATSTPPIA